jgi:hypothetical protein
MPNYQKIVRGLTSALKTEDATANAIGKAAQSAGQNAPVVANKPLTTNQDFYQSLGDAVRDRAIKAQQQMDSWDYSTPPVSLSLPKTAQGAICHRCVYWTSPALVIKSCERNKTILLAKKSLILIQVKSCERRMSPATACDLSTALITGLSF